MRKLKHLFMLCLFGMISIAANATVYSGPCGQNVQWSLDTTTGQLSIIGSGDMTDYYDFSAVPWYRYNSNITSLSIGDHITSIGHLAFYQCSKLTSVTIPISVTKIGYNAFGHCSGLTSVIIPDSVNLIDQSAFQYCSNLTSATIGNSVTKIGIGAFSFCFGLKSVKIGNSVTLIGDYAFEYCSGLTSVTIPNSVTEIGNHAFSCCSSLRIEAIPKSIIKIGNYAFEYCSSLTSVTIPYSVTSIGERAFSNCSGLTCIAVENGNTKYDSRENSNAIIETVSNTLIQGCKNTIIPNSVTKIGVGAFYYCYGLKNVTIPTSITSIGSYAFYGCSALKNVYVGWKEANKMPSIASYSFPYSTCDLYVPIGTKAIYNGNNFWNSFKDIIEFEPIIITNTDGTDASIFANEGYKVALNDNIKSISIAEGINNVNVTYTHNFEKAGVWQAWYMPFNVAFDDMKDAYDVAQIHGVLLDKDNNAVLAFLKLDDGTVKANTPYVVRPKKSGEVAITTTTDLLPTQSNSFLMMSATDKYTIGGVYEQTTTPGNWYALNLDGQFQLMGSGVYLRPFRIYMTIDPRTDNPYAQSATTTAKMDIVVIGDDETTGITSYENPSTGSGQAQNDNIYNLNGQRVTSIQKGQIYIMNGKKYIAK